MSNPFALVAQRLKAGVTADPFERRAPTRVLLERAISRRDAARSGLGDFGVNEVSAAIITDIEVMTHKSGRLTRQDRWSARSQESAPPSWLGLETELKPWPDDPQTLLPQRWKNGVLADQRDKFVALCLAVDEMGERWSSEPPRFDAVGSDDGIVAFEEGLAKLAEVVIQSPEMTDAMRSPLLVGRQATPALDAPVR